MATDTSTMMNEARLEDFAERRSRTPKTAAPAVLAAAAVATAAFVFPSAASASPTNGCTAVPTRSCSYVAQGPGSYQGAGYWSIYVNGSWVASSNYVPVPGAAVPSAKSGRLPTREGDRVQLFAGWGTVAREVGCLQMARSPWCFPSHSFSVRAEAPAGGFVSARDD